MYNTYAASIIKFRRKLEQISTRLDQAMDVEINKSVFETPLTDRAKEVCLAFGEEIKETLSHYFAAYLAQGASPYVYISYNTSTCGTRIVLPEWFHSFENLVFNKDKGLWMVDVNCFPKPFFLSSTRKDILGMGIKELHAPHAFQENHRVFTTYEEALSFSRKLTEQALKDTGKVICDLRQHAYVLSLLSPLRTFNEAEVLVDRQRKLNEKIRGKQGHVWFVDDNGAVCAASCSHVSVNRRKGLGKLYSYRVNGLGWVDASKLYCEQHEAMQDLVGRKAKELEHLEMQIALRKRELDSTNPPDNGSPAGS
jgi:hypothetical protein